MPDKIIQRTFSVAPMIDYTDRHCRYLHRLISRHCLLYTEMISTGAILHGDTARHLYLDAIEHPVAIQLGGSDPGDLSRCTELVASAGFDEINLNCGCPSDRVISGQFGAILMKNPALVADCFQAMQSVTDRPVTIKHRTGVDESESYAFLCDFIGTIAEAGCKTFIVHARKAWLKGLSPKQNREIPPLHYERVYQLKEDFPHLEIIINGGITSLAQAREHLNHVDGVMMGREAYHNPYILSEVDRLFYGDSTPPPTRISILEQFSGYVAQQLAQGNRLGHMSRHILGLYAGQPGARKFRRTISENVHRSDANEQLLMEALNELQQSGKLTSSHP